MDLQADKQVAFAVEFTDEVGNPAPTPDGATSTFSVSDPTILNLVDNGDGTGSVAATGTLGTSNLHVDVTVDGQTFSGDEVINVVAGLAERVAFNFEEPTEVTPDA